MEYIVTKEDYLALKESRRIMLATKDAHKLYEKVGFVPINNPGRYMVYDPPKK